MDNFETQIETESCYHDEIILQDRLSSRLFNYGMTLDSGWGLKAVISR